MRSIRKTAAMKNSLKTKAVSQGQKSTISMKTFNPHGDSAVDVLVAEWGAVLPSHNLAAKEITSRILRIETAIRTARNAVFERFSLLDTEFRLLAGLRRSGPPFRRSPSEISPRYVPVTSGGLTGVINRLQRRGLVSRVAHATDGRGTLIQLTEQGRVLIEQAMAVVAEVEARLISGLTDEECAAGTKFLQKLLRTMHGVLST
ncbi:MAG: MarR family winged helix-turn-helix transcriptional regulator [Steroidobacteraceae bacterium]